MARFTEDYLRKRGQRVKAARGQRDGRKILLEDMRKAASQQRWDVFLSHSFQDKDDDALIGLVDQFTSLGLSVYIDWKSDGQLDRADVSPATAETLRKRMKASRSLVFAYSTNSAISPWVPWELGFSDAAVGRVAVAPITPSLAGTAGKATGQEYLGLYSVVSHEKSKEGVPKLWVEAWEDSSEYVEFGAWLGGKDPYKRPTQ